MLIDFLRVFVASMTPVGELRLSIPLGVYVLEMPWYLVLPISLAGNMIPVIFLVNGLNSISSVLSNSANPLGRLLRWRTDVLRNRYTSRFQRYGALALIFFVAIPLPMTGAWTGSLAAVVFKIPPRTAIPIIGLGVIIAGFIVMGLTLAGAKVGPLLPF